MDAGEEGVGVIWGVERGGCMVGSRRGCRCEHFNANGLAIWVHNGGIYLGGVIYLVHIILATS